MRVGLIAGPWIPVPPPKYGGSEAVIDNLARGLRDAGHEVELFTVAESRCRVTRSWLFESAVTPIGDSMFEAVHVEAAYRSLGSVDVIHDHTVVGPLLGSHNAPVGVPVVTTAHGPFTTAARRLFTRLPRHVRLIAISQAQRRTAPEVDVTAVIPHGIDVSRYVVGPGGGGYVCFVGRMSPDKGPDRAIKAARAAGLPIVVMVKMREAAEIAYYEDVVKPLLGNDVQLLIEPPEERRIELLGRAEALLNPIQWPEPFGLVMAEALACGTPVIAFANGAAPEIVDSGRTGFLCNDLQQMVDAVGRLGEISRETCRAEAEATFSMERMVADHARLYRRLIIEQNAAARMISQDRDRRNGSLPDRRQPAQP